MTKISEKNKKIVTEARLTQRPFPIILLFRLAWLVKIKKAKIMNPRRMVLFIRYRCYILDRLFIDNDADIYDSH